MQNFDDFFFDIFRHIKREKERAKELRRSRWWKEKCQNASCYYCGRKLAPHEVTMDHIVPISRGGRSEKNNIVVSCKECNIRKKNLLPMDFKKC